MLYNVQGDFLKCVFTPLAIKVKLLVAAFNLNIFLRWALKTKITFWVIVVFSPIMNQREWTIYRLATTGSELQAQID